MKMIPGMNDQKWYRQFVKAKIDRISLLNIVICIQVAVRDTEMPKGPKKTALKTAKVIAEHLLKEGLIIEGEVRRGWEDELGIPWDENPDKTFPDLLDVKGLPWK